MVVAVVVALAAASPAVAHPGRWWWTAGRADYRLLADPSVPARFDNAFSEAAGGWDDVEDADCYGIGVRSGRMFRHFNCKVSLVAYDNDLPEPLRESFVRIVHVTGGRSFVLSKP